MKTYLNIILVILGMGLAYGQTSPQKISSEIDSVMVFLQKAQISRSAEVKIPAGKSTLVFTSLPSGLDERSLQVSANGPLTILSVSYQVNFLEEASQREEITTLEQRHKALVQDSAKQHSMLRVFFAEEQLLRNNQQIGGENTGLDLDRLHAIADFQRQRMTEVLLKQNELEAVLQTLRDTLIQINQQLRSLQEGSDRPTGEVLVSVSAERPTDAEFMISYIVPNAGWITQYDIRMDQIDEPLALHYKAQVYQNTGEEWEEVKLKLSSGNPSESGTQPELQPWNLGFIAYYERKTSYTPGRRKRTADMAVEESADGGFYADEAEDMRQEYDDEYVGSIPLETEVQLRSTTFIFDIKEPYTITSDGKSNTVDITQYSVDAHFQYLAVPKLDLDAFLTAQITDWESLNLLPGKANLFLEGTFVGHALINPDEVEDTLFLSLGRYKGIGISREKLKDYSRRQTIGGNQIDSRAFEITIRNNKTQPINITVEDQFPRSTNKDIEIEEISYDGARLDPTTQKLTWDLELAPGETRKLMFSYEVKYPKDQDLVLE